MRKRRSNNRVRHIRSRRRRALQPTKLNSLHVAYPVTAVDKRSPSRRKVRVGRRFSRSRALPSRPEASRLLANPIKQLNQLYRAVVCDNRRARREVIHAKGHAGSGNRSPRYTDRSNISCRRS